MCYDYDMGSVDPTPTNRGRAPALTSIRTRAGRTYSTDGRWQYLPDAGGVTVIYLPTGQRRRYPELRLARRATADGSLLAELVDEDTAAMCQPCPGGCGQPAAALVMTTQGPKPVCAAHQPEAVRRGYTTRQPLAVDRPVPITTRVN